MPYPKQSWSNVPATTTPLSAPRLDHMEDGIEQASVDAENALAAINLLTIEYLQDLVANMLRAGSGVALNYDDPSGLLTISSTGSGGSSVTVSNILGAGDVGRQIMAAATKADGRTAIDAQVAGDYVTTANVSTAVDARISALKGAFNGLGSLGPDGKLLSSQLPELAIVNSYAVSSQAAMLALVVQKGDIAVRTDVPENYILQAEPASVLTNWLKLSGGAGQVTSVAGKTGAVALVKADVGLGSVDNTSDASKPVSTAQLAALNTKQPLDDELTQIAALLAADDTVLQRKGGVWVASALSVLRNDLGLNDAPQIVRWVIGTGWRTSTGEAISTDPNRTRFYISTNSSAATAPTHYSDFDLWWDAP